MSHPKASITIISAFDCLFPMALSHKKAWKLMASSILKHGSRMTLEEFTDHFKKDYPKIAKIIIPAECKSK